MGPLTLLDLIGLDTSLAVLEVLQAEFGGTRYMPASLLRKLCDARLFGRKSGRGFYDYQQSTAAAATEDQAHALASAPVPAEVALIRDENGLLDELASQITAAGISVVPQPSSETGLVIVAAEPGHRVLDAALAVGHPADVVGIHFIDASTGKRGLAELVLPDVTAAGTALRRAARGQARPERGPFAGPARIPRRGTRLPAVQRRRPDVPGRFCQSSRHRYRDDARLRLPPRAASDARRRRPGARRQRPGGDARRHW